MKESKIRSTVIQTRLGAIEYRSVGTGIPIIFIHGGHSNCFETLSHKGFDPKRFQLITPSRPGYGKTPLASNHTPGQAADLLLALADHLSLERFIVYGISAGGLTALELAANNPERVDKLILASAVSKKWLDPTDKTYKTARIIFNPKVEKMTWAMVKFFSRLIPGMIAKSFHPQFSRKQLKRLEADDVRELTGAMKNYGSGQGFLNDIDQNIDTKVLSKIKCPTLIIHSENDNSVPLDHALHSHQMIQNSRLLKLNNDWGHLFWIGEDATDAIESTLEFVNQ